MRRGEVRWYRFASPDKTRPVLVLTRDSVLDYLGEVTIAPITSRVRDIPSEVVLTEEDGMLRTCAINLDHLQTVSKGRLGALVATLSATRMIEGPGSIAVRAGVSRVDSASASRRPGLVALGGVNGRPVMVRFRLR